MIRWLCSFIPDQDVERHLLVDEGEQIIDEVAHHWVVYIRSGLQCLLALLLFFFSVVGPISLGWLLILAGLGLIVHAGWRALWEHMDRFVITTMRVYRVTGVFSRTTATMPMSRILDITVRQPLIGRLLGYGHFVFESAAQEQGLRDIRAVARPNERDLTIQRTLARSGLRGPRPNATPGSMPGSMPGSVSGSTQGSSQGASQGSAQASAQGTPGIRLG